eukprot:m.247903 g.247903  ORF g.247903 m.247903 type:complete len:162 (+) comp26663_c1_seq4:108-593(+)
MDSLTQWIFGAPVAETTEELVEKDDWLLVVPGSDVEEPSGSKSKEDQLIENPSASLYAQSQARKTTAYPSYAHALQLSTSPKEASLEESWIDLSGEVHFHDNEQEEEEAASTLSTPPQHEPIAPSRSALNDDFLKSHSIIDAFAKPAKTKRRRRKNKAARR